MVDPRLVHWGYQDRDYETVATIYPETGEAVSSRRLKPDAVLVPDRGAVRAAHGAADRCGPRRLRAQVAALEARVVAAEGLGG